jgi:hypothetical protein
MLDRRLKPQHLDECDGMCRIWARLPRIDQPILRLSQYVHDFESGAGHDVQRTFNCGVDPTCLVAKGAAAKSIGQQAVRPVSLGAIEHGGE